MLHSRPPAHPHGNENLPLEETSLFLQTQPGLPFRGHAMQPNWERLEQVMVVAQSQLEGDLAPQISLLPPSFLPRDPHHPALDPLFGIF